MINSRWFYCSLSPQVYVVRVYPPFTFPKFILSGLTHFVITKFITKFITNPNIIEITSLNPRMTELSTDFTIIGMTSFDLRMKEVLLILA